MTPPSATEAPQPVRRRQARQRGPVLLATIAQLRKVEQDWCRTEDIVQLFREAQRMAR